jgi:protein-S-isoprenylcysteine O-methyltransferase Ste14
MLLLFIAGTLGGRYASPGFRENFLQPFTFLRFISVPFLFAAFLFRLATVIQLGKSFSVNLGVQPDQRLRTDFFYRYIRHPGYLSLFLGFCGVGIAFYHPVGTSLCIIFSFCGILIRIKEEEKILLQYFGESYRDYMKSTKMMIPFVV